MRQIKKHIKLIVLILTCILVYFIYHHNNEYNITYISLGDGFSMGINTSGSKGYGYNDYLKDYLKKHKKLHRYYSDFSYQDIRINDLYKDILINDKNLEEVNLKQALRESNLLTLSIGLNDLIYQSSLKQIHTKKERKEIISKVEKDLKKLLTEIKKYYKYDIYLIGYPNFYPQNSVEKSLLDELNKKYKELSTEIKVNYINIDDIFHKNSGYFTSRDNIYPLEEEYIEIYHKILKEITLES